MATSSQPQAAPTPLFTVGMTVWTKGPLEGFREAQVNEELPRNVKSDADIDLSIPSHSRGTVTKIHQIPGPPLNSAYRNGGDQTPGLVNVYNVKLTITLPIQYSLDYNNNIPHNNLRANQDDTSASRFKFKTLQAIVFVAEDIPLDKNKPVIRKGSRVRILSAAKSKTSLTDLSSVYYKIAHIWTANTNCEVFNKNRVAEYQLLQV